MTTASSIEKMCDVCEELGKPVLSYCPNCEEHLCADCARIHRRMKLTKEHKLVTFKELHKSKQDTVVEQMSAQAKPTREKDGNGFFKKCKDMGMAVWEYVQVVTSSVEDTQECPIVTIPLKEVWKDNKHKLRKCAIYNSMLSERSSKPCKTVLLVGATGAGKSTLLDGMINYIVGVKWEDNSRLKIINLTKEEEQRKTNGQAISQTEWVTAYAIPTDKASSVLYDLVVIDTPGFGYTRGIQQDQRITLQLKHLFENPQGHRIDSIDGICFVVQAPMMRLTATQRYIFHQILSLFGNDVAENIFIMATFADAKKPPIIQTLREEKVPFQKYFKFNNSAIFSKQTNEDSQSSDNETEEEDTPNLDQQFWCVCMKSFKLFFNALQKVQPKSLTLTADVLTHREQLTCDLQYIEVKVQEATQKMARIEQETEALEKNEINMRENKNFTYEVDEEKMEKIPIESGRHVTNCSYCHVTCHTNCIYANDEDKIKCSAITNGKCRVCPNECHWSKHYNRGYIFELRVETVTRTYEELRSRFETAKKGAELLFHIRNQLEEEYEVNRELVERRIQECHNCLQKLHKIALKPDPLSEADYIELLIQDEKAEAKKGFEKRIVQLNIVKQQAQVLEDIKKNKSGFHLSKINH